MANKITVNKVTLVPDEPGDEPGMPTFLVDMTWMGSMCEYHVSVELDGRDAEWEHVGGDDPAGDLDAPTWGEWTDEQVTVYEAIAATDDYKRLVAEYGA
jgi:hypothetical protein